MNALVKAIALVAIVFLLGFGTGYRRAVEDLQDMVKEKEEQDVEPTPPQHDRPGGL